MTLQFKYLFFVVASNVFLACGSSDVMQNLSAEDHFEMGKKAFDEEEYLEAINHFEIVKLQFSGSAVADDAQFYLGECRYKREEYLLAAEEYRTLIRNFSASPFVPQSQYNIALSYYKLVPKSTLDQQNTYRAIDEFQSFIDYYPTHELVSSAEAKIRELNNHLAKKDYETAELYMKLTYYKAATFYFSRVIEKFHDTPYAELSYVGKVQALFARKRYLEAKQELEKFFERFPNSKFFNEMKNLEYDIDKQLSATKSSDSIFSIKNSWNPT